MGRSRIGNVFAKWMDATTQSQGVDQGGQMNDRPRLILEKDGTTTVPPGEREAFPFEDVTLHTRESYEMLCMLGGDRNSYKDQITDELHPLP